MLFAICNLILLHTMNQIESIVLMMQNDLKGLQRAAQGFLDLQEYDERIGQFVRGYYLEGEQPLKLVLDYVENNPDFYNETGDQFRENVQLMRNIRETIVLIEKKFNLNT